MTTKPFRAAGRPTTRVLSRRRITDAALRILSHDGFDALTMTHLASNLRVTPAALYNHAASKRDILLWVQDRVMGSIDASAFETEDWHTAVRAWARSYRDVMSRYTPLIAPISVMPITGSTDTLRMYETVATGLQRGGWPVPTIVPTIVALESFIYGSAYDVGAPLDIFEAGDGATEAPVFTAAASAHYGARSDEQVADVAFDLGLEALVQGLAQRAGVATA